MADQSSGDISDSKFLTVAEVAAMMRVSKMTVYRLVHGGELPAVRVGRSFRVPRRTSTSTSARASTAPADRATRASGSDPDLGFGRPILRGRIRRRIGCRGRPDRPARATSSS